MQFIQYLFVALGAGAAVALSSLLWPKFTSQPRPEPLTKVREMVVETPLGRQVAGILGVGDESDIAPVDLSSTVTSVAGSIGTSLSQKAQETVLSGIVNEILRQYNTLPESQKEKVKEAVCKME